MAVNLEPLRAGDPPGVGRYRFLGRLGAGGMGLVCLGRAPDGRLVAVKLIHEDIAADPDYRRRFAREVSAASRIIGRFTAALVDADPNAPQPWYAAEYIDGPTLKQVVRYSGPLDERALRALAGGLADAVAAIAAAGLVHRDLKPDNILLAADGPKVIDFGIARGENDSLLTNAGSVLGSPGYMSPEQVSGERAETASDVFSLGAVLAFAGQGVGPYGDGPAQARMYLTRYGDPDCSGVPRELRHLILRCLARDPRERPLVGDLVRWWSVDPDELETLIHAPERPETRVVETTEPAESAPNGLTATQPARAADLDLGEDSESAEPWRPEVEAARRYGSESTSPSPAAPANPEAAPRAYGAAEAAQASEVAPGEQDLPAGTHVTEVEPVVVRPLPPTAPLPQQQPAGRGPVAPSSAPPQWRPGADAFGVEVPPTLVVPPTGWQPPAGAPNLPAPNLPAPNFPAPTVASPYPPNPSSPSSPQFPPNSPSRSPFAARDWTGAFPVSNQPPRAAGLGPRSGAAAPWWHQPVLADLPGGGRIRDLLAVLIGAGALAAFRFPTSWSTTLDIAVASIAVLLGLVLGFRRALAALGVYVAAALAGVTVLPGQTSASVHDPGFGFLLRLLTLVLFGAAAARLGGVGKRPILGFAVAFAASIAGTAASIAWLAHLLAGPSFLDLWRRMESVSAVYRDAGITAACSVGAAFGATWLAARSHRSGA